MMKLLLKDMNWKHVVFALLVLVIVPGIVIYANKDVARHNAERILRENAERDLEAKCLVPFDRKEAELDPACAPYLKKADAEAAATKGGK
jgi:hypothetical protein